MIPAAHAGPTEFVELVRIQPSIKGSDAYLLRLGNVICELKSEGHTDLDLASRALGRVADLSKQHSEYGRQPELTITQHITTKENGQS